MQKAPNVRTITATEFKAKCLRLMDEIDGTDTELVITKNGRPVSRLIPYREQPKTLFGIDRGRFETIGDVVSPLDAEWEAEVDPDRVIDP